MAFKSRPYHKALELQELVLAAAKKETTTPSALAQLARAWSDLEDRKRILRMKPKPKDVDVSEKARKRLPYPGMSMILNAPIEDGAAESELPNGS
jgi:hypothetical protein